MMCCGPSSAPSIRSIPGMPRRCAATPTSTRWAWASWIVGGKGRRAHRALRPQPSRSAVPARYGDALRVHLFRRVRRPVARRRQAGPVEQPADRHRAVRLQALRQGRPGSLHGEPGLLRRQAADRQSGVRHYPRSQRAHAEGPCRRVPGLAVPETGGRAAPEAGPEPGGGRDRCPC